MSVPLLILVSMAYFYTGFEQMDKNPWWLGFWGSYGVANICWMKATGAL